ncbi:MAG: glycosyl hydrolase family 8 [Endomicrobiia bacterium]
MKNTSINKYYQILLFLFTLFNHLLAAKFAFPQFKKYPYGIKPNNFTNEEMYLHLQNTFLAWKSNYLTKSGAPKGTYRIQRGSANNFDTVSEGIGYGMLILVVTDNHINTNRCYFDGLYRYYQCYLDQNGLMNWQIDKDGNIIGYNAATDADEDVALALIFAHYQWGSDGAINYLEEAKKIISKIMKYQVEKPSYILRPGDSFGGSDITNPSYFAFSWWRIFKEISKDENWQKVIDSCYSILEKAAHSQTGLIPDWCNAEGKSVEGYGYNYYYDACRIPWRVGIDYIWYGEERAYSINNKILNWLVTSTEGNVDRIVSGYQINGTPLVNYSNAAFIGPFGVGSMIDENFQGYCNSLYNKLKNYPNGGSWGYYQDCLKMLTMLTMTGNFTNFAKETTSNFTVPTCQILYPLEDEIISENIKIKVLAKDEIELRKIQLTYNNNLIHEVSISSKVFELIYDLDINNFLNSTGTLKATVYNINQSSYSYFVNLTIKAKQSIQGDGTGKVDVSPNKVFQNTLHDFIFSYTATANLELADIIFIFPEELTILDSPSQFEIINRYGSPVLLWYDFTDKMLHMKFLKIFKGEKFDVFIRNVKISNVTGSYNLIIKSKNNGGIERQLPNSPQIEIFSLSKGNQALNNTKKVISLNNDYINDLISFDSDEVYIYDVNGKKITEIKSNLWDGKDKNSNTVSSGIYFYKTKTGNRGIIFVLK